MRISTTDGEAGAKAAATATVAATAAATGADATAAEAEPATSSSKTSEPCFTLSPKATLTSLTTPADEDGISIDALSDSTVIKLCSARTVSPALTMSSITVTSSKSPMSGTCISIVAMFGSPWALRVQRVDLIGLDAVLGNRFGHFGGGQVAVFAQRLERGDHNVMAVDLEVLAQFASEVAAAKAVGT